MVVAVVVSWLRLVVVFASFPAVASLSPVAASWLLRLLCLACGWLLCLRRFRRLRHCFLRLCHGFCVLVVVGCCVCVVSGACVIISGGCVVVVVMVVSCGCVWLLFPAVCVMISVGCIVVVAVVAFCGCGWLSQLHSRFLRLCCCGCAVVFQGCIVVVPVWLLWLPPLSWLFLLSLLLVVVVDDSCCCSCLPWFHHCFPLFPGCFPRPCLCSVFIQIFLTVVKVTASVTDVAAYTALQNSCNCLLQWMVATVM